MSDYLVIDNVTIPQGTTFVRRYPVEALGTLFADATAAAQVRASAASVDVLFSFTVTMVPDPDDPNSGTVQIACAPAASWGFDWTDGVFDVVVTESDSTKLRIAQGSVTVNAGVTR